LWLNAGYYLVRLAVGAWAALQGKGEAGRYPGMSGKFRLAWAFLIADLQALRMLPKILRKRNQINQIRRLTPRQVKDLILRYRISLKELSEQGL